MTNAIIQKYLAGYAEKEAAHLTIQKSYEHSLIIPAKRETSSSLKAVWSRIPKQASLLVIVVINSSKANEESETRLFDDLTKDKSKTELRKGIYFVAQANAPDLLIIDRFSENRTISIRQGVGLARKIGSDIALQLYSSKYINSPWLRNTDADAILPADYFDSEIMGVAGFLYPFIHPRSRIENNRDKGQRFQDHLATSLYDLSLLYYPAGLLWAGSPYAFPTIGSTLCCSAKAYAHVRGFPKRSTGEDFYLLNKLRKVGPIKPLDCSPIELSSRHSTRVPIGTGQAIAKISGLDNPIQEFEFEHPHCFVKLREFIKVLRKLAESSTTDLFHQDQTISLYTQTSGLERILEKLKEQTRPEIRLKFLMDWFDALRTRQFIHHARDMECGSLPFIELTRYFSFKKSSEAAIPLMRYQFANQIYKNNFAKTSSL